MMTITQIKDWTVALLNPFVVVPFALPMLLKLDVKISLLLIAVSVYLIGWLLVWYKVYDGGRKLNIS